MCGILYNKAVDWAPGCVSRVLLWSCYFDLGIAGFFP